MRCLAGPYLRLINRGRQDEPSGRRGKGSNRQHSHKGAKANACSEITGEKGWGGVPSIDRRKVEEQLGESGGGWKVWMTDR